MINGTLVLVIQGESLLLGEKTTGVCSGKLVQPGGKVKPGEGFCASAIRETEEETGITPVLPKLRIATLFFNNPATGDRFRIAVYRAMSFSGVARDSRELIHVGWYPVDRSTLMRMMRGDALWLPYALRKEQGLFTAEIVYTETWEVFYSSISVSGHLEAPPE